MPPSPQASDPGMIAILFLEHTRTCTRMARLILAHQRSQRFLTASGALSAQQTAERRTVNQ